MENVEAVQRTLSGKAIHRSWKERYRTEDAERVVIKYFRYLVKRLRLSPNDRILDVGCGTAYNSVRLAKMGFNVEGIDYSTFALEEGQKHISACGVADRVTLRQGDLTCLEIPDNTYDVVLCLAVLMHIPDVDTAIRELARILKPHGKLLISEANWRAPEFRISELYWRYLSKHSIEIEHKEDFVNVWLREPGSELLSRKWRIPALIKRMREAGLEFEWKKPVDLTEQYTRFRSKILKRLIHGLNTAWFELGGPASLAVGNYLAFTKR